MNNFLKLTGLILTLGYMTSFNYKSNIAEDAQKGMNRNHEVIEMQIKLEELEKEQEETFTLKNGLVSYIVNNNPYPVEGHRNESEKILDNLYRSARNDAQHLYTQAENKYDSLTLVKDSLENALSAHPMVQDYEAKLDNRWNPF